MLLNPSLPKIKRLMVNVAPHGKLQKQAVPLNWMTTNMNFAVFKDIIQKTDTISTGNSFNLWRPNLCSQVSTMECWINETSNSNIIIDIIRCQINYLEMCKMGVRTSGKTNYAMPCVVFIYLIRKSKVLM